MTPTASTDLNARQAEACALLQGQLLVLAGPGTGKTRVITHRYRNLMALPGVDTSNILVLTFTDKAAREMEERITLLSETGFADLAVSTFHAFALRFLQDEGAVLPIPHPFRIAPAVEKWKSMCEVLEAERPSELYQLPRPRDVVPEILKLLERAKQEMVGPADYLAAATAQVTGHRLGSELHMQVARLYQLQTEALMRRGMLDFDDTIYWTVRLLESNPAVLARYRQRFSHIMVDEFQDTNFAQLRLVELLAGESGNVAVVGDDDQSIYKFRGASVANLRRFRRTYPGTGIVRLEENYRSTRQVLDVANRLVGRNTERVDKTVVSDRTGPPVRLYRAADREHEVAWVVERIADLVGGAGSGGPVSAGEVAVLVRTNNQLRYFTRAMQRAGLPYQLSGGRGFLDQPEIKDVRALLQWTSDPGDVQAACRVLAMAGVGVPAEHILRLAATARRDGATIEEVLERVDMPEDARASVDAVIRVLESLREASLRERVDEVLYRGLEQTRYVRLLDYDSEIQRLQAGANIQKFRELIDAFCENDAEGTTSTLGHFIDHLRAVDESGGEQTIATIETGDNAVHLMTVHQAKGLEFEAVFCPGLVEERFPARGRAERLTLPEEVIPEEASSRDPRLAEERRLAYVAVTRAKTHLFLSCAERYEGGKRWKPSRFLAEMGLVPGPDGSVAEKPPPEDDPVVAPPPAPTPAQAPLPLNHPEVPELLVSYSQLDAYITCPRAYQYAHVYRLPARPSPELEFGTAVHLALSRVLSRSRADLAADPTGPVQPELAWCLATFDEAFTAHHFCDPTNADLWQERGRGFIADLHRKGRLSGRSLYADPELEFTLRLPGFRVRGRIDRIDRVGARYQVIDYKTGEPRQEWELERDLQLGIYHAAAERVLGLKPVDLAICYLDDATEVPVLKTTSQVEADLAVAGEAAAGIISGDFAPRPEPWKCSHCDFRLVCDAAL